MCKSITIKGATPSPSGLPEHDESCLETYLKAIGKHDLLAEDEVIRLTWLIKQSDDKSAIEKMITANLRLVVKIAMDFRKYWMDSFLDIVQEGNIGLAKAVRKFDPDKKVKFSYYASYWIKAYIMKYLMENKRLIKIGTTQAQRKLYYTLDKEVRRLESFGVKPEPAEVAKNLDVTENDVVEMTQRLNGSEVSIYSPLTTGETKCLGDTLSAGGKTVEEIVTRRKEKGYVRSIISRNMSLFNEKEQAIINQRLLSMNSRTLKYIADQFNVSRERIRQIEAALMIKLRDIFKREMPDRVAA